MAKRLVIYLGHDQSTRLEFEVSTNPIAEAWLECMDQRHQWCLDDPKRFYGFGSPSEEKTKAENLLKQCINTINDHEFLIDRPFTSIDDQDYLNYLHHIFEVYHGLLDQQNSLWWLDAPDIVKSSLSQLNIAIHRAESLRAPCKRFVCTWFGMPKTRALSRELRQRYHSIDTEFGGVYLNYVEIGKTVLDLVNDNDQYIGHDAFQPFRRYSADFVVYFFNSDAAAVQSDLERIDAYYLDNRDFFQQHGVLNSRDIDALPTRFKVAQLVYHDADEVIELISKNQYISRVEIE